MDNVSLDYYMKRLSAMERERSSFISHWKEISKYIQPRRGRFDIHDRNKGDKRYNDINNSKATQAVRVARSGLLAGMMSPARPWFALETPDPDMMEFGPVKDWLYKVELKMRAIFNQSNFYNMAPTLLNELLLFGTGVMTETEDFDTVARFYTHSAGSYMIDQDSTYRVNTVGRKFMWTVGQIVEAFGLENVSSAIKTAYDNSNYEGWYPVCHIIEPNREYIRGSAKAMEKRWTSCYFEPGGKPAEKKFLSKKGFDEFPAFCPRWDVTNEDVYGTDCPGMLALGDVKALQLMEKRKAQAMDMMLSPPLKGPPSLENIPVSGLPSSVNIYASDPNDPRGLSPVYEVRPNLTDLRYDMAAIEQRIDEAFYVDLFLAITNMEGIQPRNELDLIQRNEERLLQLGPVLERLQGELLNGIIDRTFNLGIKAGIFPIPPKELEGVGLRVKYISSLAMAQRAVATGAIERVAGFTGSLIQAGFEEARNKFDAEQAIDEYASSIGAPPRIIVPDEVVAQKKQLQEEQMAQMQAQQEMAGIASAVKDGSAGVKNIAAAAAMEGA